MRVLVFGDSITQGYFDLDKGGWVQRILIDLLKIKVRNPAESSEYFNLGVSGDVTANVVNRIESEINDRLWANDPVAVIVAVGLNDTRIIDDKTPISSPEQFAKELSEIHRIAELHAKKLMFVGLTPVDETLCTPWKFNPGPQKLYWRNDRIRDFEQEMIEFARKNNSACVPIFDEFLKQMQDGKDLLADGLHPNNAGHEFIAQIVRPKLDILLN